MGGILSSDTEHSHEVTFARSLIVPVYRNEGNIPALIEALEMLNLRSPAPIEVVFVIDGAPDRSGEVLAARRGEFHFAYQIVFHSRNFGSFTAIRTGMEHARGRLIAVMAADLQEPPELVLEFFARLDAGDVDIVFGERTGRNDAWLRDKLSNMFWWLYRKLVIRDIPKGGVDIFACNQMVAQTVLQICEPNSSLIAQLFWVGFRRAFVPYRRRERQIGESGWSFSRRMRYMMTAGFPTTVAYGGTSRVTTAPAPIIAPRPIRTPGRIVAFAPTETSSSRTVCAKTSGYCLERGKRSLVNVALGPTKTRCPRRNPSHNCTPHFKVTSSPTTTSFSMNTLSQTLQPLPSLAPGNTCANAQIRVPAPMDSLSHMPCGCTK